MMDGSPRVSERLTHFIECESVDLNEALQASVEKITATAFGVLPQTASEHPSQKLTPSFSTRDGPDIRLRRP